MHRLGWILLGLLAVSSLLAEDADPNDFSKYLQGRHVYKSQCAPCHGMRGKGDGPWAEGMTLAPRNFRMGIFKYRSTPMGYQPTDDDLRRTIRRGVSGTAMPTFAKTLNDRDLTAILVYLKNLSRRWDEAERHTEAASLPVPPDWFLDSDGLQTHLVAGKETFQLVCASCHGSKGRGDGPGSVGLTNAWGFPAAPADLQSEHHRSGPGRDDLFRTISLGLDGTPMIGFREVLGDEKIWELIAYIESLPSTR